MSRKHLRRDPQHVAKDQTWWYYEEPAGLTVVVEPRAPFGEKSATTRMVILPWSRIRAALKRKDAKP